MKVILDENISRKLKRMLIAPDIQCVTVKDAGFRGKTNGALLALIDHVYDVLLTMDKSIRKQQNLSGRKIAILLLRSQSNDIQFILPYLHEIRAALRNMKPGEFREIGWGLGPEEIRRA